MAWTPDYITVGQLASYMRVPDTEDDVELAWAVTAASRAVDRATNRQFGQDAAPVARYYTPVWDDRRKWWAIDVDDLQNVSGLAVAYDSSGDQTYSTTVTGYRLLPLNAAANGRPYTELLVQNLSTTSLRPDLTRLQDGTVRVTAQFGWTAVPDSIVQATLIQASRFMSRRDSPYGVAGGATDGNAQLRLQSRLDPDVAVSLSPYKRWWGAA